MLYRNIFCYGDDDYVGIMNLLKVNFIFKKIFWVLLFLFILFLLLFWNNYSFIIFLCRDFEIYMLIEGIFNGRVDVCMYLFMLFCC